jgi:hypothetical protein
MLRFSSFEELSESKLTFGEIVRDDRAFRLELFLRKYKGNEPFELTDGSQVTLQYDAAIEKALRAGDAKTGNKIGLMTNTGQKIAFGSLAKTQEFGGGRGSGGGSDNTRATESAQCVYLQAIWDDPSTKFSPDDIRNAYKKTFTDATLEDVLLGDNNWIGSSIEIARILYRVLKRQGTYSFHRGSDWVDSLENKFKALNRQEKLFQNVNKWTPADIWLVKKGKEGAYDIDGCDSINALNQVLLQAFKERDIIGVSLKTTAGGKPRLAQVNYKKPFKPPVFQSVSYNKRGDFFKSKDGYLFGQGGVEIQFRTFPTFQCEVIGKKAKHGKVSHGGIDSALYATTRNKTEARKTLEAEIKKDREGFLDKFYGFYSGEVTNPVDRQEFSKKLASKNVEWLVSKYYVTTIFTMIKGREQDFMSSLYRVAKSESADSAVHLKVM